RIPGFAVRRRLIRGMRQGHRPVEQEWLSLVAVDEVQRALEFKVGAVFPLGVIDFTTVEFVPGIGVTWRTTVDLPETVFIKASVSRSVESGAKLPFADDAGLVTGLLNELCKRGISRIEITKSLIVAYVVLPGHELRA